MNTGHPVLTLSDARIVVDDIVAIEQISLVSKGDRVLLVGEADELLSLLTGVSMGSRSRGTKASSSDLPGKARLSRGEASVLGMSILPSGTHLLHTGVAALDPPLPPQWTAEQYVAWGARLSGASASASAELAANALARAGLAQARKRLLPTLALPERRALLLAHAGVTSPPLIIAEAPLSGLEGAAAEFVLAALAALTEGRKAIVSASRLSPASPEGFLAEGASYVAVIAGGNVALSGTPGELLSGTSIYGLTVRGNAAALEHELTQRGLRCTGGPKHFSVVLPEGASTRDILIAAKAAGATLIELLPFI